MLYIGCMPSTRRIYKPRRIIEFAGEEWLVKFSPERIRRGPGPNLWSDHTENVWVDDQGYLHLRLSKVDDQWFCAEVMSRRHFGRGTYSFQIAGSIDSFDPNVVLGLFTWSTRAKKDHHREVDIEFSRFGNKERENGHYVIQPYDIRGNEHPFNFKTREDVTSHQMQWSKKKLQFSSWEGTLQEKNVNDSIIEDWTYTGDSLKKPGDAKVHINLYLFRGQPPENDREVEIIIQAFRHEDDV